MIPFERIVFFKEDKKGKEKEIPKSKKRENVLTEL